MQVKGPHPSLVLLLEIKIEVFTYGRSKFASYLLLKRTKRLFKQVGDTGTHMFGQKDVLLAFCQESFKLDF